MTEPWERAIDEHERLSQDALALRKLLWLRHGHDGLYGDDGEMQCSRCPLDFLRDSVDHITRVFQRQGLAVLAEHMRD